MSQVTAIGGGYISRALHAAGQAYGRISSDWMRQGDDWCLVGGNVSYKGEVLRSLRPAFDPDIAFGSAETELHARLRKQGLQSFRTDELDVLHHGDVGTIRLAEKAVFQGLGARRILEKHGYGTETEDLAIASSTFHAWLYSSFYKAGHSVAPEQVPLVGRWSFQLLLMILGVLVSGVSQGIRSRTRSWWSRTRQCTLREFTRIKKLAALFLERARVLAGKAFYFSIGAARFLIGFIYWRMYHAASMTIGIARHLAIRFYWSAYRAASRGYWALHHTVGLVHGLLRRAASLIYWTCHRGATSIYWSLYRAASFCYWRLHRVTSFVYWRAHRILSWSFWRVYHYACVAKGRSIRCSVAVYWMARRAITFVRWKCYGAGCEIYWTGVRTSNGIRWRVRALFSFVYWKTHSYLMRSQSHAVRRMRDLTLNGLGALRALQFLLNAGIHLPPWTGAGSLFQEWRRVFIRESHLKGSKTSRFLHHIWKRRQSRSHSWVWLGDRDIIERARLASRFGYTEFLVANTELSAQLKEHGFLARVLSAPNDDLVENTIPFVRRGFQGGCLTSVTWIAIAADCTPKEIAIAADWANASGATLLLSDFGSGSFDPVAAYETSRDLLTRREFRKIRWEALHILRPFDHPLSPQRLLEGNNLKSEEGQPEWSVVIPYFRTPDYLEAVLRHLHRQDYSAGTVEIIVVDDGSPEPLQLDDSRVRVVRLERESGDSTFRAGVARNAGIRHSRGRKLLFIDSDILLAPDHLRRLDGALMKAELVQIRRLMLNAGASSADTEIHSISSDDTYPEDDYWEDFKATDDWNRMSAPWKYVCSYSLALTRETLNRVKAFRPEFCEYGFEDTEFGYRLFRDGCRFHLLQEPVYHLYPQTRSWAVHFDPAARQRALTSTARLFFSMHRDPSIFYELHSLLVPELESLVPIIMLRANRQLS